MGQSSVSGRIRELVDSIETVVVGKREAVELTVAGLASGGHVLIEDIPGVGKTTLAKALAKSLGCSFRRIQFTPDLLPADITGVNIFNQKRGEFEFREGPIFANIVLADEINRATPKTQAALLECMEEHQVTVDGTTYVLPEPFFVIATENPIEYEGTYRLPEAQVDRFLLRVSVGYPSGREEVRILDDQTEQHPLIRLRPVADRHDVIELQEAVKHVYVEDSLKDYIVAVVAATRHHQDVLLGASPRGSLALRRCAQALAATDGRAFVTPDDIKRAAVPTLAHRLIAKPELSLRRRTARDVVEDILKSVLVPIAGSVA
jgi:MoxR-like ATPase